MDAQWILGQDGLDSKDLSPRLLPLHGRLFLDLLDQFGDAGPIGIVREVLPAGEGGEHDGLRGGRSLPSWGAVGERCQVLGEKEG